MVTKIKNNDSQAVIIYAFEPEADILTKEFNQQQVDKLIVYNDSVPMTNDYSIYEGKYNIGSKATSEQQKEDWGLKEQNAAYAVYLYDIGNQIIDGFENASEYGEIPTSEAALV